MVKRRSKEGKFSFHMDFWTIVKIVTVLLLVLFLIYPFSSLIYRSFFTGETPGFTLDNYKTFFTKPYYYNTLKNSLVVSIITTLTATLIGVPLAYAMTRYDISGKRAVRTMIIMSLMSPPFIGAYSWIMLFGRSGFITKILENINITMPPIYGKLGIILVFTFKLFPYVYLYVSGAMGSIDKSLEEAAENLGSSKLRRLMTITLPVVMPSIAAGAVMVFMSSLADFGTPMLIGEGYKVLPVLVYEEYMSEMGGNANLASALSVVIVICSTIVLLAQKYFVSRKNYVMTSLRPPEVVKLKGGKRVLISALVYLIALISILPQLVVVITSFIKTNGPIFVNGFSLDSYKNILTRLSTNISNTFIFASIAIVVILVFGMFISYLTVKQKGKVSQFLDLLIMFPYVIPGAVLGISLLVAFNKQPLLLTGTPFIIVIAYVVRKIPYTVRSGSAIMQQIDPSIEEASINLGVSPMKTFFKVTARLMAPGVLSGAILSWITCINELSSSIMLYTGKTSTISVAIYTEVVRNSFGTAAALASILTLATVLSLALFSWISKGKVSVI
ncbi:MULTISPECIES: ABC transporter permease [Clostridium]|uniref:Iron(III) transport system permease protein n=1 Tax=Clostridium cadaveris TaxID=1529 RepID=A0A1I2KK04_9CLOT|nr:iron ABC transporter permease [Clostridium cadaveris]MDU4953665.1 iron ABC transporter permease [Clostridium sp.]MDM8311880.1 iron ABC transporter permease [Clostridium cadaveris]MDY4949437.1 iron ABC transporter permease [Clostridium cadaveris]NME64534.1 iron ABC transporter permease [Clostridium cadaveris]NWK11294.1 iron ABC transporter permease [Clostridium cadaveris]